MWRNAETGATSDLRKLEIAVEELEIEEKSLARDGFGQVYKARRSNEQVVVKVINVGDDEERHKVMDEASLTIRLNHPNVVKLFGVARVKQKKIGIVMELSARGSLDKCIGKIYRVKLTEIALGIIDGLEYVHSQKVIHRDIKSNNILIFGREDDMIPKIADFGVSKVIQTEAMTHTRVGQDLYMAPEVKMLYHYSFPADIFILAMTLFEMFNEQLILQSSAEVKDFIVAVHSGKVGDIPQICRVPEYLNGVVKRDWNEKPEKRPTLSEYFSALKG